MNYLNEQKRTLSFRRLPFAAKRRRARPLMAAARRALKTAAFVVPLLALSAWFVVSDRFALSEFEARGAQRVEPHWFEQQVAPLMGKNLLLSDLQALRSGLDEHPWVSELRLQKELPRKLIVTVTEHVPAAVLESPEGRYLLSPAGDRIVEVEGDPIDAAPLLILDPGNAMGADEIARLIELGRLLERASTPWARRIESLRVLSPEDVEMTFAESGMALRVRTNSSFQELEERIATVDDLLPQLEDRLGRFRTVDLRFERRIVLDPFEPRTEQMGTASTLPAHAETSSATSAPRPTAALIEEHCLSRTPSSQGINNCNRARSERNDQA